MVGLGVVSPRILSIETELCYQAGLNVFETKIDTGWYPVREPWEDAAVVGTFQESPRPFFFLPGYDSPQN